MGNKDNWLRLVADLVEMLIEYGADESSVIETLGAYGISKDECKEWYGLTLDEDEDEDEDEEEKEDE